VVFRAASLRAGQDDTPLHRVVKKCEVVDGCNPQEQRAHHEVVDRILLDEAGLFDWHVGKTAPVVDKLARKADVLKSQKEGDHRAVQSPWKPVEELHHGEGLDARVHYHNRVLAQLDHVVDLLNRIARQLQVNAERNVEDADDHRAGQEVHLWVKRIVGYVAKDDPAEDEAHSLQVLDHGVTSLHVKVVDLDEVEDEGAQAGHDKDEDKPLLMGALRL